MISVQTADLLKMISVCTHMAEQDIDINEYMSDYENNFTNNLFENIMTMTIMAHIKQMKKKPKKEEQVFEFKPFSVKQKKVLTWWQDGSPYANHDAIIADGAVRSGKTVSMSLGFVLWAMEEYRGKNFALCGKTIGSLRRNVVDPLKSMLKAIGYTVSDHRTDNILMISNGVSFNFFFLFGGKDEGSQDLVQGITLAGVFFDEVALMPESFVNQATARCSIEGSKYWFNCNPESPYHWFKVNWIDKFKEKQVLYLHFTMRDNLSLSERIIQRYERMYTGVFYDRYIRGLWVISSGVIYDMFDDDRHIISMRGHKFDEYFVSCDYGTHNPCTFGLFGIDYLDDDSIYIHQIRSYYYNGREESKQKSDSDYAKDMKEFLGGFIHKVKSIIVDPSASSFITELEKPKYKMPGIVKADNTVTDGIRTVQNYIRNDQFSMDPSCVEDKKEFKNYVWDIKAGKRGLDQPIKEHDHAMDKIRYLIYTLFRDGVTHYDEKVHNKGKFNHESEMQRQLKAHARRANVDKP